MKLNFLSYCMLLVLALPFLLGCEQSEESSKNINLLSDVLNYTGTPVSASDRSSLVFSDQGAWFAYGFHSDSSLQGGFSGPFLMTQENGVWSGKSLSRLQLTDQKSGEVFNWKSFSYRCSAFSSHLLQVYENEYIKLEQTLFFCTPHSSMITSTITNKAQESIFILPQWIGEVFSETIFLSEMDNTIAITSDKSQAKGSIQVYGDEIKDLNIGRDYYSIFLKEIEIKGGESKSLVLTHTFLFPEYDPIAEQSLIDEVIKDPGYTLNQRVKEKAEQYSKLEQKMDSAWDNDEYKCLLQKCMLTLQNNWRIPAGELKHAGLFPSYHYIWFHGFWAWDSWKHAAALAHFHPSLARDQIRAMYDFQSDDGFIADCIYRDTLIEAHNYRNTKPPLSAWAVWKVFQEDPNIEFLQELYPKIMNQHRWWYSNRDHDNDGLCEYGSTDGSLIAAKWESGMDNAVRFDQSKIIQNNEKAWSLDQESVDLNAYLYAEKLFLIHMASQLNKKDDSTALSQEAISLKTKIQQQFFDPVSGWFYDTSIDGNELIKVMGCEGWIPLWAEAATTEQAEAVKNNMMDPDLFNTKVPFQTLSANHPDFDPDGGYWRGPNWIDQAYFGIMGLRKYGFQEESYEANYKIMHQAEGLMQKGSSIRENYNPINGKGLESENFSWSAAHYLLLLINE